MAILRLVDKALSELRKRGVEAEVYVREIIDTDILALRNAIDRISRGSHIEMGLRIVIGKRVGVVGGMVTSEGDIVKLVDYGISITKTVKGNPDWKSLPRRLGKASVEAVYDKNVANPNLRNFIDNILYGFDYVKKLDKRAELSVASISFRILRRCIANTYGEKVFDEVTRVNAYVEVKARENGLESSFYDMYAAPTLTDFKLERMLSKATDIAVKTIKSKVLESGKYDVLLTGRVFASIINTVLVPAVCADQVQNKRSPLAGKIDQEIFSNRISVVDDGTAPNMFGSAHFDDEGIPMRQKVVFAKGVLKTFLYDTYTALKEGKESTANALRRAISAPPSPWATNFIVLPGNTEFEDMLREIKHGIVVYETIGEWLSSPVSGFVNAAVSVGAYVENGEIKFGVKGIVINGNIYEMLKEDIVLGKTLENYVNIYAPPIILRNIVIAGK